MSGINVLSVLDEVIEADEALPKIRRLVLDLAVRGKLVDSLPADESVDALLHRVNAEKVRLVREKIVRKPAAPNTIHDGDKPFLIPTGWKWVRFGSIAHFSAGRTPARHDLSYWNTGDHSWVSIGDMVDGGQVSATRETVSDKAKNEVFGSDPASPGTIIMSFKLTIGKISRLTVPAFHNEAIVSIRPYIAELDSYLFKVLPQFARLGTTKGAVKGATLNRESIANILLPLPPLSEQERIVRRIDELMALCDSLDDELTTMRESRARLLDAVLYQALPASLVPAQAAQ
ncbi:restriction endonuclease subunit S [Micromonospora sp. NPDC094482]|uniref:restriction endonuclease subunit S n=1 Tax=unclassified Micromonospora TaxID=2617518 RepID=UPI003326FF7D